MALEVRGLFFDVWPADDVNGTALGELTESYDRTFAVFRNAIGAGQFSINRHDAQYTDGWAAQDNFVRVRRVEGGPFDPDDSRYVGGFWIETGTDVVIGRGGEGDEEITRGGRTPEAYLERAVVYPDGTSGLVTVQDDRTRIDGNWHFTDDAAGQVIRIFLADAAARGALEFLTHDFSTIRDSNDVEWDDVNTDWAIPVGTNYLDLLGTAVSGGFLYKCGADLILHGYQDDPGSDLSASIELQAARDVAEGSDREVQARSTKSRVIVQGTKKNNRLKFREVVNATVEAVAAIGRREGFVEYKATPTDAKLDSAGNRFISKMKRRHDGPDTAKVLEYTGRVAFEDYNVWDTVKYHVPGEYSHRSVVVYGITIVQRAANDTDVIVQFEQSPFDPASGDNAEITDDQTKPGPGKGCNDCPDQPPYVPTPTGTTAVHAIVYKGCCGDTSDAAPNVHFDSTGDSPGAGLAADPKVGPFSYLSDGSGHYSGLTITGDCTVDIEVRVKTSAAWLGSGTLTVNILKNGGSIGSNTQSFNNHFATLSFHVLVTGVTLHNGDVITVTGGPASNGQNSHWGASSGTVPNGLSVSGTAPDMSTVPPPTPGQTTTEEIAGDGSTTAFQTNYPYEPGSLVVTVDGLEWPVDETDPTTGTFTFDSAPPNDAVILVHYQIADDTATGANNPQPSPSTPSGGGGSALTVAEDGSTVVSPATGGLDFRHGLDVTAPGGGVARVAVDESEFTYGSVTAQTSFGLSSSNGSAGTPAHSDHTHGTPAGNIEDIAAASTDATKVFAPDGAGGVIARDETAVSGVLLNKFGEEHVVQAHGSMGSTETMDLANGNVHSGILDANCTITLTGFTAGKRCIMQVPLTENGTGGYTPTFSSAGTIVWVGGTTPSHPTTAGTVTEYLFWSDDGGTTIYAGQVGNAGGTLTPSAFTFPGATSPAQTAEGQAVWDTDDDVLTIGTGAARKTFGYLGTTTPLVESGTGTPGTSNEIAHVDHVHPAASSSGGTGTDHHHVAQEEHSSDGSSTTFVLDEYFDEGSVTARNQTTGHWLGVTETLPDTVVVSAAGTAGDVIAFAYAASVI